MIWHVPNLTPVSELRSAAFLKYYTNNNFLDDYGGTLQSLYANNAPIVHAGGWICSKSIKNAAQQVKFGT